MAIVTAVSMGTSNKVTVDYQSQEVSINLTYELERGDEDVQAFVTEKAAEIERAHSAVWRRIREIRAEQKAKDAASNAKPSDETTPSKDAVGAATAAESPVVTTEAPKARRARNAKAPDNGNGDGTKATPEGNGQGDWVPVGPEDVSASVAQQRAILSLANRAGMNDQTLTTLLMERVGKSAVEHLTRQEAARLLVEIQQHAKTAVRMAA